ncbi:MAG TPA: PQQ-binding-like beta-propeller repeat protein, partial [Vicinamibacteria bacterium]|nr:PQQ-binding-like beta-propeller repeat protein [Vicinamibacteria bacterium]
MKLQGLAAATLVTLALVPPLSAQDWPWWRGALGSGVSPEKGLPERWTEKDVAWRAALGGSGVSSPVVWGQRVFVTSQQGQGGLKPGRHPRLVR